MTPIPTRRCRSHSSRSITIQPTLKSFSCVVVKSSLFWEASRFPGGQFDADDATAPIDNCDDPQTRAAISAAARELFEELGVLLVRGGDPLIRVNARPSWMI